MPSHQGPLSQLRWSTWLKVLSFQFLSTLLADWAHSLCDDDHFALFSLNLIKYSEGERKCITKIIYARSLTSALKSLNMSCNIFTELIIKLIICSYFMNAFIELAPHLLNHNKLLKTLTKRLLDICVDQNLMMIHVTLNYNEYKILDKLN